MLAKNVFAKAIVILGVEMLHEKKDKSNKDVVFFTRTDSLWILCFSDQDLLQTKSYKNG